MAVLAAATAIVLTGVRVDSGGAAFAAAAGGGDSFPNGPGVFLVVANGDGSPHTVTASSNGAATVCNFGITSTAHDVAVAVTNAQTVAIGPFPAIRFNDSNGRVQLTYSAVTSVKVATFFCPSA